MSVFNCIKYAEKYGRDSDIYETIYRKVATSVGQIVRLHKTQCNKYKELLQKVKPKMS